MSSGKPEFDEASQKELAKFLEGENAKMRLQQSIHTFTDLCWDKCISKLKDWKKHEIDKPHPLT
ncbi:6258_t:CDS:2, partial [Scutellospora calospora]